MEATTSLSMRGLRKMSDRQLMEIAQSENNGRGERAFGVLSTRFRHKMTCLASRILKDPELAEDAVQDAFLMSYRARNKFRHEATFSSWIYRITTNAALMIRRKRVCSAIGNADSLDAFREISGEDPAWLSTSPFDDPAVICTTNALLRVVTEAVADLKPEIRAVVLCRAMDNADNASTSSEMGISIAAVKSRLHRGRVAAQGVVDRYREELRSLHLE